MKYDTIGIGYDTTRRPDPRIAGRLHALLGPAAGGRCLDVACGTGNYTQALAGLGVDVVGVDQSRVMLAGARAKAPAMAWVEADALALPFPPASFEGVLCTQAIHHFPDLAAVFREMRRVLASAGRIVIFGATREQMRGYWLDAYFPEAMRRSSEQMPSQGMVSAAIGAAGLRIATEEAWDVPADPVDLFLYAGKHRPAIYLDERVRRGISTFASLADPAEVARGLARLEADMASGAHEQTKARHVTGLGDYTFWVAVPA